MWRNPVNQQPALYIASHAYAVVGMEDAAGQARIQHLLEHATQAQYRYCHQWAVGDVLIWDERAILHRGRPWPYDQVRSLASICVSSQDCDGLGQMRSS